MVSVQSVLLVHAFLAASFFTSVQASAFGSEPSVPREGDGITIMDRNSMVRGAPVPPVTYQFATDDGQLVTMNGTQVVSTDMMLDSAFNPQESQDLYYLEWFYGTKFEINADTINTNWKKATVTKMPWPGSYWPNFNDGINYRWDSAASAAEKYAKANNMNVATFMNKVSSDTGVDAWYWAKKCTSGSQCGSGSRCGIRYGKTSGYCIPSWVGLCHAWAPAAMQEDEPKCPVTVNGVKFKVQDMKALMVQIYDGAGIGVLYGGVRFDGGDGNQKDQYGRYQNYAHRDIGPALFHIVLANVMGKLKKQFLVDVESGEQVWNQPLRSYEFVNTVSMTPDAAAQYYFNTPSYSVFNKDAKTVYYVKTTFKYIEEGYEDGQLSIPSKIDWYTATVTYEYLLELDASKNIIGGEWLGNSKNKHPDFLWVPVRKPDPNLVTDLGISYAFVTDLFKKSIAATC